MNTISKLTQLGQSLWYDNIQRKILENGEFKAMIERGDIRGVTSNPSIFNAAIAKSTDYDAALKSLAWAGWDAEKIFWQLAIEDIRAACDAFAPLYEETDGGDGFVSLEVSPYIANDTDATITQVEQLWARVRRPNLMIKIPATQAGVPAIRKAISVGINVNVTLIFSLARYAEVMDAYLSGLEDRLAAGRARLELLELLEAAGAKKVWSRPVREQSFGFHLLGTCRMGNDPKTAVLNRFNQCWDAKNVFVTDGAAFVSSACQNPTLTILALTMRASEYIADEYKRGNL